MSQAPVIPQDSFRRLLVEVMEGRRADGRKESYGQFGAVLAQTIAPDRKPYSRQYVDMLRRGKAEITPEIARALEVLAAMLDGQSDTQARAREYRVLAVHNLPPGCVILGKPRGCALAGCRVAFVPASPRQLYCGPDCRKEAQKRRAAARRAAVGAPGVGVKRASNCGFGRVGQ